MDVTIYHNPACGTSRTTLELIRNAGIEPRIIEYLRTPPSRSELARLVTATGLPAREVLRSKEPLAGELELTDPARSDDELLTAMAEHPILMNRPIVVTPHGVRLCRPAERVLEILPASTTE